MLPTNLKQGLNNKEVASSGVTQTVLLIIQNKSPPVFNTGGVGSITSKLKGGIDKLLAPHVVTLNKISEILIVVVPAFATNPTGIVKLAVPPVNVTLATLPRDRLAPLMS